MGSPASSTGLGGLGNAGHGPRVPPWSRGADPCPRHGRFPFPSSFRKRSGPPGEGTPAWSIPRSFLTPTRDRFGDQPLRVLDSLPDREGQVGRPLLRFEAVERPYVPGQPLLEKHACPLLQTLPEHRALALFQSFRPLRAEYRSAELQEKVSRHLGGVDGDLGWRFLARLFEQHEGPLKETILDRQVLLQGGHQLELPELLRPVFPEGDPRPASKLEDLPGRILLQAGVHPAEAAFRLPDGRPGIAAFPCEKPDRNRRVRRLPPGVRISLPVGGEPLRGRLEITVLGVKTGGTEQQIGTLLAFREPFRHDRVKIGGPPRLPPLGGGGTHRPGGLPRLP